MEPAQAQNPSGTRPAFSRALPGTSRRGGPARGEPDTRAIWDHDEALAGLETILDTIVDDIAPDGTQFADERESLLWGFVNTLHMQTVRPDRTVDKLSPKLRDLQSAQDGSEVQAWELERVIERAQHLGDRRDAFEQLRDAAAERYRSDTGNTCMPVAAVGRRPMPAGWRSRSSSSRCNRWCFRSTWTRSSRPLLGWRRR